MENYSRHHRHRRVDDFLVRIKVIKDSWPHGGTAAAASVAIAGQAFPGLSSALHSGLFRKASLVDLHFWHSCDNTRFTVY
ncbi:hypothetical protein ANTPLA_LOCUS6223 [Anthophora plagiata]